MNVIDKIQFNPDHRWEITKDFPMFLIAVFDERTGNLVANASADNLSTALCCAYNRVNMAEENKTQ